MFDRYKGYFIPMAALLSLVLILQFVKMGQQLAFERDLKVANQRLTQVKSDVQTAKASLEKVKSNHLTQYTRDISFDSVDQIVKGVEEICQKAPKEKKMRDKRMALVSINARLSNISQKIGFNTDYFNQLDTAKANYVQEVGNLGSALETFRVYIATQVKAGFFERHFTEANALAKDAGNLRVKAMTTQKTIIEKNLPDYLLIYQTSLEGKRLADNALATAKAVPARFESNNQRIGSIPGRIQAAQLRYAEARAAADWLEDYPNYRCLAAVVAAGARITSVNTYLETARQQNTMMEQNFSGAAETLATAENLLTGYQSTFNAAINDRQKVQSAKNSLYNARNEAQNTINNAQSHINSYTENDQSDAESYLRDARSDFQAARGMEASDPPRSLSKYREAESGADSAYNAVDTVDHTPPPSYSDDDSSSGSSSWPDSSGSSGGYTGSGGSDYSSPSGGGSGGSDYSSPSGGGDNSSPTGGGDNGDW